jgi:D-arabinose 1-dehydrogenase-like Zn-dependent alcohol dehydrogenase
MKAAVLHEFGAIPRYEDFPDPVAEDGEVVVGRSRGSMACPRA